MNGSHMNSIDIDDLYEFPEPDEPTNVDRSSNQDEHINDLYMLVAEKVDELDDGAREMRNDIDSLRNDVDLLLNISSGITQHDVQSMQHDVQSMQHDVQSMQHDVQSLRDIIREQNSLIGHQHRLIVDNRRKLINLERYMYPRELVAPPNRNRYFSVIWDVLVAQFLIVTVVGHIFGI
jgi:predicted  nucleic acid-binding Zn-ribbon protein